MKQRPLWQLLSRPAAFGMIVLAFLLAFHFALLAIKLTNSSNEQKLSIQLPQLAEIVEVAWRENNYPLLVQLLDNAKKTQFLQEAWLIDLDGKIVVATNDIEVGNTFLIKNEQLEHYKISEMGTLSAIPAEIDRSIFMKGMFGRGILFTTIGVIILVFFVRWRMRSLVTSLRNTTIAARAMADGDFARILPEQECLEINEVTHSLNYAAGRLQTLTDDLQEQVLLTREATAAKNIFLANMSHELRTPLNAVLGFGSLLNDTELSKEQRGYLTQMHNAGELLLGIISDLLDFSRIEMGHLDLVPVIFSPQRILHETADLLAVRATDKNLQYRLDISSDLPEFVMADASRIRQVLINLLNNSIKFTEIGHVLLRSHWQTIGESSGILHIEISDSGIGMDELSQAQLFTPFMQAHETIRERFGGTGLGLSICKQIITAMNGTITVKSELGEGSCFTVEIPMHIAPNENISFSQNTPDMEKLRDLSILVVEDNPVNRLMLVTMLRKWDCKIDEADNGAKACLLAANKTYDLIFMDCQMPIMDGLEATRQLRNQGRNRDTTIIALTANAFVQDKQNCLDAGMNSFMTKPITNEQLLSAIQQWLNKDHHH
jgi:signal transduction histidine kinase/ActR/RegA family two-component response regulator